MATRTQKHEVNKAAAAVAAAVSAGMPSPLLSTTQEPKAGKSRQKGKVKGVTKDYSGEGERDCKIMVTIDRAADQERVKLLKGLEFYARGGYGESAGKKLKFNPVAESYFAGWNKFRDAQPEATKAAITIRISEARRVCNGYIVKNKAYMDALLDGPGSYHQKVMALPTMTSGGQGKNNTRGTATTPTAQSPAVTTEALATLSKAEQAQRVVIVAKFTATEIGAMVSGLTEAQLPATINALAIRLAASKDKAFKELGKQIHAYMNADAATQAKETKQQKAA